MVLGPGVDFVLEVLGLLDGVAGTLDGIGGVLNLVSSLLHRVTLGVKINTNGNDTGYQGGNYQLNHRAFLVKATLTP